MLHAVLREQLLNEPLLREEQISVGSSVPVEPQEGDRSPSGQCALLAELPQTGELLDELVSAQDICGED